MSWVPPNLAESCAVSTTITTCQPSTFIFLELVVRLFGRSRDATQSSKSDVFGFSSEDFGQAFGHDYSWESFDLGSGEAKTNTFDFIVVGAGSAGCVVANRLTEIKKWNVLLLEAGIEEPDAADVPAFAPTTQRSNIDWGYQTQAQPHSCQARTNQRCDWPRGRVMGGSSVLNYMIYLRGGPKDYDEWGAHNPGWSYKEVLPYFLKSENNHQLGGSKYHSTGGYLNVETFPYQDRPTLSMLEAFTELGLPEFDQNTPHQIGTMLFQHTTRDGERLSANAAFIRPIRKRKNLMLVTQAQVIRVLIDPAKKSAYGVEYVQNGKMVRALASKEVIVSGGTINSPKVLMLSGIGPREHLETIGIKTIKDLPVGQNLHDHTTHDGVLFALTNYSATTVSNEQQTQDMYKFRETKRGPLASTGPLQINALVQTKYEDEEDRPDIQYSIDAVNVRNFISDPILTMETNVLPLAYYDGFMVRSVLLTPKSRGVIMLNSSDPIFGTPLIYANTFKERIDLRRIVRGIQQSLSLLKTKALRKLGVTLVSNPLPACAQYEFATDDYWACIVSSYTATIYHQVGTCRMGPKQDKTSVVDHELKVHGIDNLRVIDASIMPKIVRANTNAATIMIAEKGSDAIKVKWLKKTQKPAFLQSDEDGVTNNEKDFESLFNFKK